MAIDTGVLSETAIEEEIRRVASKIWKLAQTAEQVGEEGPKLSMCPCCGFNLTPDKIVVVGSWRLTASWTELDGVRLNLTQAESALLHTLAREKGRFVKADPLGRRISFAEDPTNIVSVVLNRLRKKLGDLCPVETMRGHGYRWNHELAPGKAVTL